MQSMDENSQAMHKPHGGTRTPPCNSIRCAYDRYIRFSLRSAEAIAVLVSSAPVA